MGYMEKEACPALFIHNLVEWGIEDHKGKSLDKIREMRSHKTKGKTTCSRAC
jgi:arsenate reductase (thioredoxin)